MDQSCQSIACALRKVAIRSRMQQRKPKTVATRSGHLEFLKINTGTEWRDVYQWILSLTWPRFAALITAAYIAINLLFATLYWLSGNGIAGMPPGSFPAAFFFSVQTLATVGYGHMYPQTTYGHVVATIEIMSGMFWLAVAEVWMLAVRALQVHLGEYPGHPRDFWCALGLVGWVPGTIVAVPFAVEQMKRPAPRGDAGD